MEEKWKPIKGFEEQYLISNFGRVYSIRSDQFLTARNGNRGYKVVTLCVKRKYYNRSLHRLVAEHFVENPDNLPQVHHKDHNKHNNKIDNLEWCNQSYNSIMAVKAGKMASQKLSVDNVREIRKLKMEGMQTKLVALKFGISKTTVRNICCGRRWFHL